MVDTIQQIALWALPVLAAIIFHEVSHGWVAYRLGDPTAARMGRLTLNPIAHIDPIGTILLPALLIISNAPFLFGYAKPVPVNFQQSEESEAGYGLGRIGRAGHESSVGGELYRGFEDWLAADCGGSRSILLRPAW